MILRWNNRLPTKELVLNFLKVCTAREIIDTLKAVFRNLKEQGLEAIANIELTATGGKYGKPNNTVHSHILTDDPRSVAKLKRLLITACERHGLVKNIDFWISDHRELYDPDGYIDYFTKYGYSHKVILFKKGTGINKFYTIGQWFQKGKGKIWDEIKAHMQAKNPDNIEPELNDCNPAVEVPIEGKLDIELEKRFLQQEYGIDLDAYTGGDDSITEFYVPDLGKFRRFAGLGWLLTDDCPSAPAQWTRHKEAIQEPKDHKQARDTALMPKEYHPQGRTIDRRHEWTRFTHNVAVLR